MSERVYPVVIAPLTVEDGGGFAATVPDLPGCMSDGASPQEALRNVQDAIEAWIAMAHDLGHAVPRPRAIPSAHSVNPVRSIG